MFEGDIIDLNENGIGRLYHGDTAIHVPFTLPTERVSGIIHNDQLEQLRIITPSAQRVAPSCTHFKRCGGCQLQHFEAAAQSNWKMAQLEILLSQANINTDIRPIIAAPPHARRRATFALRRTKRAAMVGFYQARSHNLVQITQCPVCTPDVLAAIPVLHEYAVKGLSRNARASALVTAGQGGLDVLIKGGKDLSPSLVAQFAQFAPSADILRLTWNGELVFERAPFRVDFDGITVTPPPGAFLQPTQMTQDAMIRLICDILGGANKIVDLFAGCGTFALPLARHAPVHAVEGSDAQTKASQRAWRQAGGLYDFTAQTRDLFKNPLLALAFTGVDGVVIDPPRAGAGAQMAQLAQSMVKKIAYVSCNPNSFVRDAKTLCNAGYHLDWVQPIDQFLYTAQLELVAAFHKR